MAPHVDAEADQNKNHPANPRMISDRTRCGSEERSQDKSTHFLCGKPHRGLHGGQDQQLGAQRGRMGGVRALKRRAMARELSGDHHQPAGSLLLSSSGVECDRIAICRRGRVGGGLAGRRHQGAVERRGSANKNQRADPSMIYDRRSYRRNLRAIGTV